MNAPSKRELLAAQAGFFQIVGGCAAVIVVIHLLPMGHARHSLWRLLCTVAYLGAALLLVWQMLEPRSRYLQLWYAWRFEDCPPALERCWRRYLHALDQAANVFVYLLLAFLGSTAVATLHLWFHGLSALAPAANLVWWLSLIGLLLFPFAGGFLLGELAQRYRQLNEQLALTPDYRPRERQELYADDEPEDRTPVEVRNVGTFRAGGIDWDWEDFTKNCIVFGQTGSGKTVCVLNALLDGLLASAGGSAGGPAGLILDPKGDFRGKLQSLCRRLNRESDLLILDPAEPRRSMRWNPFDSDDDELELAARFAAVLEAQGQKAGDTTFWIDSARKFLRHAIALLRRTNPAGEPPSFAQLGTLASSFNAILERTERLDTRDSVADACLSFFAHEWAQLANETRSSIQSHITNMVDPFVMPPYDRLFSGKSTVRLADVVERGQILYVDMPIADKTAMARMAGTFLKLEYFREVLKRPGKIRPSFFLCDEFQVFFTTAHGKGDADFFERTRQSNHVNLVATQNLPALLKQSERKEVAHNLLGNCAIKVFLRNTDRDTNQFASELFGQELVAMGSASGGGGSVGLGRFSVQGVGQSAGVSDQYDQIVRPERFTKLAIPTRNAGADYCEAIVHLAARAQVTHRPRRLRWKIHPLTD